MKKKLIKEDFKKLERIARDIRKNILVMSYRAQSAHTGGALSCVEILVSLYFKIMKVYPKNPYSQKRDRLFFSKAHDAKALYAVLSERGFFSKKILEVYEINGGKLPGHSTRHVVPGVEISAGSLGHGLSIAAGSAYSLKIKNSKSRVYAILSDGECDEGSTWEAILFAGHHKLDNLVAIVDYNKLQSYGFTKDILELEPFMDKWKSFGWNSLETDGNDFKKLIPIIDKAIRFKTKPTVIIAHTIKGLGGVKKHINSVSSQYKPPTKEEMEELFKKI